ncbi:MAG: sensor histidine kinase, partial [Pseudorhizobium sp.]
RLSHPDDNSTNILVLFDDVTDRQHETAEMEFIVSETRHRMKNLFAVVRSVAMQTHAEGPMAAAYRQTLLGRLEATFRAQEIAATNEAADFQALVTQAISEPALDRVSFEGPAVQVPSSRVLTISMIFHELMTNAVKYGALSHPDGKIHITWSLETGARDRTYLNCEWRERSGPPVTPPAHSGYGTQLIKATSAQAGGSAELTYEPDGCAALIQVPV